MDTDLIIVGHCVRINQVVFRHKVNKELFLSSILNCFIVLTFVMNAFNIIQICLNNIN